jgi:methyl halide transferase
MAIETNDLTPDNPMFWELRYQSQNTSWDLDQPAPPFVDLLAQQPFPPGKTAVLGSGLGHDAALFGKAGFEVTGLDYAPTAIEAAQARYGQWVKFVQTDIFNLPQALIGQFDYVIEHTCFCAIPLQQRQAYVQSVYQLLKPQGKLIGLFFAHHEEGGPPFKTDEAELRTLFSPYFEIQSLAQAQNSTAKRQGEELLAIFQRRA